jgi:replication-associated recombination protein RarA
LQKAVRRGDEKQALHWVFELTASGLAGLAFKRLETIVWEDVGVTDQLAGLYARRAIEDAKEWFPDRPTWKLAIANAVMALCRATKCRDSDNLQVLVRMERAQGLGPGPIPDYALDKHTMRGKKMGRWDEHFVNVGTILLPEDHSNPDYAAASRKGKEGTYRFVWEHEVECRVEPPKPTKDSTEQRKLGVEE